MSRRRPDIGCHAARAGGAEAAFRAYLIHRPDTDPARSKPCRLLPAALTAVDPGEIWMLDSVTSTPRRIGHQVVTILAVPGAVGSVVANGADAMSIATASVKVVLRNLVFVNLAGGSNNGIAMTGGSSLTVVDSQFSNLPNAAIYLNNTGMKGQIIRSSFVNNAVAVRVFAGVVTLMDSHIANSVVAMEAAGTGYLGGSNAGISPPTGPTRVYVRGGSIINSGTAFHMESAGSRLAGGCNGANIYLEGSTLVPQIVSYTTLLSVTGASDINGGCGGSVSMGGYSSPTP